MTTIVTLRGPLVRVTITYRDAVKLITPEEYQKAREYSNDEVEDEDKMSAFRTAVCKYGALHLLKSSEMINKGITIDDSDTDVDLDERDNL